MAESKRKLDFPDRKISETFLHFAEPLLDAFGPNVTETQMEQPLMIAFTVWNAVVYADAAGNSHFLDGIQCSTAHEPELVTFISQLIVRKRSLFGGDCRLIGEYKVFRKNGKMRVQAEARDPFSANR